MERRKKIKSHSFMFSSLWKSHQVKGSLKLCKKWTEKKWEHISSCRKIIHQHMHKFLSQFAMNCLRSRALVALLCVCRGGVGKTKTLRQVKMRFFGKFHDFLCVEATKMMTKLKILQEKLSNIGKGIYWCVKKNFIFSIIAYRYYDKKSSNQGKHILLHNKYLNHRNENSSEYFYKERDELRVDWCHYDCCLR